MRAGILVLTLALAACGVSTSVIVLEPGPRTPVSPEQVRVFLAADEVPGEYTRLAVIHAEGDPTFNDQQEIVQRLREEAAKLGADAIILGTFQEPSTGAKVANALLGTNADRKIEAVAIRLDGGR